MIALLLMLAQAMSASAPVSAPPAVPIAGVPVPDPVLAEQRGGFRLPSGIDVALTVQTQTAVNGALLLRTVFQVDQGTPQFTIMAPKTGETVAVEMGGAAKSAAAAPTISFDRTTGLQVSPGAVQPAVSVSAAAATTDAVPAGLVTVAPGAVTDAGTITETTRNGTRAVTLGGPDLTITHLAGNAFGSAIANSGSDRGIDTQTTVSITLGNAGPDVLGSTMFRMQDMALDAAAMRAR